MALSNVIFSVNNDRYPSLFDRSQLRLGSHVFVEFDSKNIPKTFSSVQSPLSVCHSVMWISPSEWYVVLQEKFIVDNSFSDRVVKEIQPYIERDFVEKALYIAASDIRPEHMFKTSEINDSRLAVILTVIERLDLCSKLNNPTTAKHILHHYRPLVAYLLLTCFDRLGQPADWLDFSSWLKSSNKKEEREAILSLQVKYDFSTTIKLVEGYNNIYGVRNSFYRFIRDILPDNYRRLLFESIWIEIVDNPPKLGNNRQGDDREKEHYLFKLRNDYTHKAQFVPGVTKGIWPEGVCDNNVWEMAQQIFYHSNWKSISVKNWPDILDHVVRVGLAKYIKNIVAK